MRKDKLEAGRVKQTFSNKRGDRWQPSWPLGREEDEDRERIPLQLSFISFSRSKAGDSIDSREVAASCWVLLCGLFRQKDLYYSRHKGRKKEKTRTHTHTHTLLTSFKCTKKKRAKNDFGSERRTLLACSSCFTVRFACIARRVAVAMSRRFCPRTLAVARSRCQTPSASQPPCCSNSCSKTQRERRD